MKVSIGLPNAVPGTTGAELVEWARRAEAAGFASLGTIDRIVYDNYEPLLALAAAAAVTDRIGLATTVLLGPLRPNVAELAKQARSLQALSGGRFTLGLGLGAREDDYEASGIPQSGKGERLEAALSGLREIWDGDQVGPAAGGVPGLVVGGYVDASLERAARFGDGWIAGGMAPDDYRAMVEKLEAAWRASGREGRPRRLALSYFSLGEAATEAASAYLTDYYAFLGEATASAVAASAATDAAAVQGQLTAYEGAGCEELILFPCAADPAQVELLAAAAGL